MYRFLQVMHLTRKSIRSESNAARRLVQAMDLAITPEPAWAPVRRRDDLGDLEALAAAIAKGA